MKVKLLYICLILKLNIVQGQWVRKNDFPGLGREGALGFSLNGKGYIGCGVRGDEKKDSNGNYLGDTVIHFTDFWQYDPTSDTWIKKADFPGISSYYGASFILNGKAYAGLGLKDQKGTAHYGRDLYEYDDKNDIWSRKADLPRFYDLSTFFSIDSIGYVTTSLWTNGSYFNDTLVNETWGYNAVLDKWERKADFPGEQRDWACAFSVNGKGYVGLGAGEAHSVLTDFYEYDPKKDSWRRIPDFPGIAHWSAGSFTIKNKGYIVGGSANYENSNELWEYDPVIEKWTKMNSLPGKGRYEGPAFVINDNAYYGVARGWSVYSFLTDFYQFSPKSTDTTHTLGIHEISNKNLLVYPNPSSSGFTISYKKENIKIITLSIKNTNGQTLYCKEFKNITGTFSEQINLSEAAKGIYILEFVSDREKITNKLVLE